MSTVRIQVRRGTAAQWTSADPTLEAGELGFESDTNKFKFGNGDDVWSALSYAAPGLTDFTNTLDDYLTVGQRGTANGVASLNSSTKIPNEQIDSATWATRSLVRATVSGLQLHESVTYATTAALTATYAAGTTDWFGGTAIGATLTLNATGVLTIDGASMTSGARILVKDQANLLHNGLYTVTTAGATGVAAVLTRTDDASDEFSPALYGGSIVYVQLGTANANKQFVQLTKGTAANKGIIVGTDNIDWTQYSGAANITAGTGITKSGDTISVNTIGLTLSNTTLDGTVTLPSQSITSTMIENGTIVNADINASAAIDWAKLAISSTVDATKIGYLNGITSSVQNQIDTKSPSANPTFTGAVILPTTTSIGNVSDTEIGYLDGVTSSVQTQIDTKAPIANPTFTGTVGGVTKSMVGLGNVDNTADSAKPVSTAAQTALDLKANLAGPTFTGTVSGITKSMVGLGSVDNTADTAKPVSTAQQTALDLKANLASPTFTGTVTIPSGASISGFAPLASPALTGVPTAPTAAAATNTTQVATTAFVRGEVTALVNGASAALDTLGELATALTADEATAATLATLVGTKAPIASPTFTGTVTIPAGASISGFAPLASPTFTGTNTVAALTVSGSGLITASSAGIAFTDGTQTKEAIPSRTTIVQKTASYTLSSLTERDNLIEVASASGTTLTIPLNATIAYPVGTSIDILQTSTGQVTIAGAAGVTVNATPGLKLRTQWSSATLFKRATDTWVVMGDLTA
jgi:hypothetical protein